MPSVRRLTTLVGATFAGFAVAGLIASPALACNATIIGKPVCDTKTGTVTVTWTVSNDAWDATFTAAATPKDTDLSKTQGTVPGRGSVQIVQTGVPGDAPATITVQVVWPDNGNGRRRTTQQKASTPVKTPCVKETPSPSPSRSHGGGGGGAGSPTPSHSPGVPSLPVTGSNVPIYAGSAVGLVGLGSVLFLVARRRRIRFEA